MEDKDKKQKPPVSKWKFRLIIFFTFFFRSFIILFLGAVVFLVAGIFRRECLIVGAALLGLDLILSICFMIRTSMLKGSHEMFNMIVKAASEEDGGQEITVKPDKEDLYSERANDLRHKASEANTVREVFELYQRDIEDMALTDETYTVYIKREEYFFDRKMHYVISFDRTREINDDIEHHLYMDILFDPDKFDSGIGNIFEATADGDKTGFFEQVREYLESNALMDLVVEDINTGASY